MPNFHTVFAKPPLHDMKIAIIAITCGGALLGDKLRQAMAGSELYISERYIEKVSGGCVTFLPTELKTLMTTLWKKYDGFIMIMATGIVVRMIAPLIESKTKDPAIVVMDDAGQVAISLLSGHLGGANELAELCASATGAVAVITTATDANNLPSFDLLAKQMGWEIENIDKVKTLNRVLLDNQEIAAVDTSGKVKNWLHGRGRVKFYDTFAEATSSGADGLLFVTNCYLPLKLCPNNLLILRPRNLVLGIGCNRGASADEIEELINLNFKHLFLSRKSICCIATISAKRNEAGLLECATRLGVPMRCFESVELNQVSCPSPSSDYAMAAVGASGVAEPSAILASNGGSLILQKVKSANVTLAIAELKRS